MRRAVTVGFVGVCLLLFAAGAATTAASTAAGRDAHWRTAIEAALPQNAATGRKQSVSINSVSCSSAGNCSAVGTYRDKSPNAVPRSPNAVPPPRRPPPDTQGLLLTQKAGKWGRGVQAALPENARETRQFVQLYAVSCSSPGNCGAVGSYVDSSGSTQALLLTETAGVWAHGVEPDLPANAAATGGAGLVSISCASAGNCGAVGDYADSSGNDHLLLLSETAGNWATGVEAKLPANASPHKAWVASISCASPGSCTAVGGYIDGSGYSQGLILDETAGSWATGVAASLPANDAARDAYVGLFAVSCGSAGNCSAVGSYCAVGNCGTLGNGSGSSGVEGLLLTETDGSWATGVEADLPKDAATMSPLEYLNSVSCSSAGNCSAAGSYRDRSGNDELLLLTETAGSWTPGVEASVPANAARVQVELGVNSVSCSSPGNCTVGGSYSVGGLDDTQGLLLTETDGVWATGVEAGLPEDAHTKYQDAWVTVSCGSAQDCTGVGLYTDSSGGQQGLLTASSPMLSVVPNVKGRILAAAKRLIKSQGYSLGGIRHARSPGNKNGRVISQKPRSGRWVKLGSRISLVVGKGAPNS